MESHHALRTLQKKRTSNFREDETKLLIQLWGSPQIQNKLFLTHRKAPVMRVLAANMQRHGFYRTPDEIKTRIRNLKCLYHRIKRTVQSGAGLGTVDPDWPHYKAMDSILSKEMIKKENLYKDNVLEGPRCEDIKREIEDIEIKDDMESFTTNSDHGSEFGDDSNHLPSLTPAPSKEERTPPRVLPTLLPNFTIPIQTQQVTSTPNNVTNRTNGVPSLPFPLFIVQQKPQVNNGDKKTNKPPNLTTLQTIPQIQQQPQTSNNPGEVSTILKELLEVQKENLTVEKERLELEKERLEYHKHIGNQLMPLIPIFGGLLQKLFFSNGDSSILETSSPRNGKRKSSSDDILRESKILRTVLEKNIKKYMLGDEYQEEDTEEKDDSGIELSKESN